METTEKTLEATPKRGRPSKDASYKFMVNLNPLDQIFRLKEGGAVKLNGINYYKAQHGEMAEALTVMDNGKKYPYHVHFNFSTLKAVQWEEIQARYAKNPIVSNGTIIACDTYERALDTLRDHFKKSFSDAPMLRPLHPDREITNTVGGKNDAFKIVN